MTGYEILLAELQQRYSASKVKQNEHFIRDIVKLLSEGDGKEAIEVAEKIKAETNAKLHEVIHISQETENERRKSQDLERKTRHDLESIASERQRIEEAMNTLNECETPEGRDKIRLANFFLSNTNNASDAVIRGLSNILGNGGNNHQKQSGKNSVKESEGWSL